MRQVLNLIHVFVLSLLSIIVFSQSQPKHSNYEKIIFGCQSETIQDFESFVISAKAQGATHINLVNKDIPLSYWQYDSPGDPYPAWAIGTVGLLKISIPEALKPYLPAEYAESIMTILEKRCKVLRKHGMKAALYTFEPQMLPEKVFTDHPLWRGARVDHPMRSRVARFAPTIDNPEVLELYRESIEKLIHRCPEIEIMNLSTNDAGTGLDWSGGLYSGRFGNSLYENVPMDKRLLSFFKALQEGAKAASGSLEINMDRTRENDPEKIAKALSKGMAIEYLEGPDATPFMARAGSRGHDIYYPVVGIPQPISFLESLHKASMVDASRLSVSFRDQFSKDLYLSIYAKFQQNPYTDEVSKQEFLKEIAVTEVGSGNAELLIDLWIHLQNSKRLMRLLNSGGYIMTNGGVHQRWITRPFVPFPDKLTAEEKDYFRKFQFQARSEENADDMIDMQATRIYAGWGGKWFVDKVIYTALRDIEKAHKNALKLQKQLKGEKSEKYKLLALRLKAYILLLNNANNAVSYQAQIDRVKELSIKPDKHQVIGTESGWDRQLMMETARKEIDNTALLMELLQTTGEPIIDMAPVKEEEDIRRLGTDLSKQLQKKLNIMNAHWEDYKKIFNTPNL